MAGERDRPSAPVDDPRREPSGARRHPRVRRARRELPRRARRAARRRATGCAFVICRQEGGAAYMAEAFGKLTGTPGLAFVTRGPGATNAAIGIHTAMQDSTPMIVFVGPGRRRHGRPRGVPGNRLSTHVRQCRQVGGADRSCAAHPRVRRARVSARDVGAAGARRTGVAGGHAHGHRDCARRATRLRRARRARRARRRPSARGAGRCAHALRARRRQPVGRGSLRSLRSFAEHTGLPVGMRVSQPGPLRQPPSAVTPAMSASASIRSWPRACATPTYCW